MSILAITGVLYGFALVIYLLQEGIWWLLQRIDDAWDSYSSGSESDSFSESSLE